MWRTLVTPIRKPIISYQHLQKSINDNTKVFDTIHHGILTYPNTYHSFNWSAFYQCTHSVIELIHHADKYGSRLILDVSPNDVNAYFLWKGLKHMYPQTFIFYTYSSANEDWMARMEKHQCDRPDMIENVKLTVPEGTPFGTVHNPRYSLLNFMVTTEPSSPTQTQHATWIHNKPIISFHQPLLLVPYSTLPLKEFKVTK